MSFSQTIGNSQIKGDFTQLNNLVKELKSKHYVDIGILGKENIDGDITIAGIGAVQMFGRIDGSIPPRDFIKMPLLEKSKEIQKKIESKIQKLIEKQDIEGIFKLIGIYGEVAIQEAFETGGFGNWPELKPQTIKRKGSSAILIDDGTLRKSITSKVGKL